ncbi:hypothetical protein VQM69_03860, partial [Helicobacter pylori]
MKNSNRLIYTDNLEESLEETASLFEHHIKFYTEIIEKDKKVIKTFNKDFKIEHAKEVLSKAHLKHSELNAFLIAAPSYGIEAQNALLKILEERFKNTPFVLLDEDNKVKFSNIGAFVASFKNDTLIKTPYFALKKQGFYLTDSTPTN